MDWKSILTQVVSSGILTGGSRGVSLPNIPFPTMGGEFFWNTLAEYNGWRMQQNMFTQHIRIIDPDNIRRAWGDFDGMKRLFDSCSEADVPNGFSF